MALSITWNGRCDTDIEFSEFFGGDHTVAVRFMVQFANSYPGPVLAVHGTGRYLIATGDADDADNSLVVRIADGALLIPVLPNFAGHWHHLAAVRAGNTITVHLDGKAAGSFAISAGDTPAGLVRLGRGDEIHHQFYGFVDDVAIFTAALSTAQIQALVAAQTLKGTEQQLLAGFVFGDGQAGTLPVTLTRPLDLVPGARLVSLAPGHDSHADRPALPLSLVNHMKLPFPAGQIARVVQGFGGTASHHGYAAFCYDLVFPLADIDGFTFRASAPGTVAKVRESGPNTDQGPSNFVTVEQSSGEFCDYLHLQQNSATVTAGQQVGAGTGLAKVGRSGTGGPHLHQAVTNLGEHTTDRAHFVTIPFPYLQLRVPGERRRQLDAGHPRLPEAGPVGPAGGTHLAGALHRRFQPVVRRRGAVVRGDLPGVPAALRRALAAGLAVVQPQRRGGRHRAAIHGGVAEGRRR